MLLRWFPWKFVISRIARAGGIVDPVRILSRLESFAQPLEVKEPLELLRAGLVFHARGLLNTVAIQHNLDWIWPYWVARQYDPHSPSFIPRAFSATHINLTHRNWTAVGRPDCEHLPIVDPRGLVTPHWDGWSIDAWVVAADGRRLVPAVCGMVEQRLLFEDELTVVTRSAEGALDLVGAVTVVERDERNCCELHYQARGIPGSWLVVSLRPANPEGVSFVHVIDTSQGGAIWRVGRQAVRFLERPRAVRLSRYHEGDVSLRLFDDSAGRADRVECPVGMATAAALFPIESEAGTSVTVRIPLEPKPIFPRRRRSWAAVLSRTAPAHLPRHLRQFLYDAAIRSLILHAPAGEAWPGPYTYKRFWFRDAAFILDALLAIGLFERAEAVIDRFPERQLRNGFFRSQDGEWDSNGEALWIMSRFCRMSGRRPKPQWEEAIRLGAEWIAKKRTRVTGHPDSGLLPAGFSAEHLGPNDVYYWDDFWGVAGLRAAGEMLRMFGDERGARDLEDESDDLFRCIERSLQGCFGRLRRAAMPASPHRRLDSGAIGSLAAGYPLKLFDPRDPRLLDTAEWLMSDCLVDGGFYQDIVHSGINPYLSLHLAEVLARAGDARARELIRTVASLATPTGQWPEAIHPRTGGGCMGDGHHAWASAEWILMTRNAFLREEGEDRLVVGSAIPPEWVTGTEGFSFGPAPTEFGEVTVSFVPRDEAVEFRIYGSWRRVPTVEVRLPSVEPVEMSGTRDACFLSRKGVRT
ncbi:MAG: hypothetical protein WBX15_16455 [Thermoanaerobaculia bacterium]